MIQILDKKDCCGCHACAVICAKRCITMREDNEGFLYPDVDVEACINCGLCEKVCPIINHNEPRRPLKVYAAKNRNEEIRRQSSSGGIFTLLAETVINNNGVVFGAKFDSDWNVVHSWTESLEDVAAFRGAKYVQSVIGNTYREAKAFLQQGRQVLFSGTPCQIAGLKKYLHREYENLLTVDVVCHGVPSPLFWRTYLLKLNNEKTPISYVNLRSKKRGWSQYSYVIKTGNKVLYDDYAYKSEFSQGFSLNLTIRPSCYSCVAKSGSSFSDITLADCWGIDKLQFDGNDNKGVSAVLIYTQKGVSLLSDSMSIQQTMPLEYDFVIDNNKSIVSSAYKPYCRAMFWERVPLVGIKAVTEVKDKLRRNIIFRIYNKIRTHYIR